MRLRAALVGAGITCAALFGGLLFGLLTGSFVFDILPGNSFVNPNPVNIAIAALFAMAGFLGGSALWGVGMGRLAHSRETKRMAIAGACGFAPVTLGLALLLQVLEPIAVEKLGAQVPIHRLFTSFFVPTAFLIAGVSAFAIGIGLRERALARRLSWRAGLAAASAFALTNLFMESIGYVVGAPGAGDRATMLTVLFTGNIVAAFAGGAVMGVGLTRGSVAVPAASPIKV